MSRSFPRIIPVLLNRHDRLVKTINFSQPSYIGDPLNTILMFSELGADELILLDILASKTESGPNFRLVRRIAEFARMPLCYGGGVTTIAQAHELFALGIEKISINSAIQSSAKLVGELATEFGRQAVVASLDFRRNSTGEVGVFFHKTNFFSNVAPVDYARRLEDMGAGEILLTSIDREGTWLGPEIEVAAEIAESVGIPVVTSGGIGSDEDISMVASKTSCTGIGVGNIAVYQKEASGVLVGLPSGANHRSNFAEKL